MKNQQQSIGKLMARVNALSIVLTALIENTPDKNSLANIVDEAKEELLRQRISSQIGNPPLDAEKVQEVLDYENSEIERWVQLIRNRANNGTT